MENASTNNITFKPDPKTPINPTKTVDVERAPTSAFETGNPDFDPSKDCPAARGADSSASIIANN